MLILQFCKVHYSISMFCYKLYSFGHISFNHVKEIMFVSYQLLSVC